MRTSPDPAADTQHPPDPRFVARLRSELLIAAAHLERVESPVTQRPTMAPARAASVSRISRQPWAEAATSRLPAFLTATLVAIVVAGVAIVGRPDRSQPPIIPVAQMIATAATPPAAAGVASFVDPGRTNAQPGPLFSTAPVVTARSDRPAASIVAANGALFTVSQNRIAKLNASTLATIWTRAIPGSTYSAPATDGHAVFVGDARNTEAGGGRASENLLVAFSTDDGRELWRVEGAGSFPGAPLVDDGVVYSVGVSDRFYTVGAYRAVDGERIWRVDLGPFSGCCVAAPVALAQGLVAVSDGASLAVLRADTGALVWKAVPPFGPSIGSPMIMNDRLFVMARSNDVPFDASRQQHQRGAISAYDLRTGSPLWTNDDIRGPSGGTLAGFDGVIYAGGWADQAAPIVARLSLDTGAIAWSTALPVDAADPPTMNGGFSSSGPTIVGDAVMIAASSQPFAQTGWLTSRLTAIDLARGSVRWTANVDGVASSRPLAVDGRLYISADGAAVSLIEGSGQVLPGSTAPIDLVNRVSCTQPSGTSPMLGDLPADPSRPAVADWKQEVGVSQLPTDAGPVSGEAGQAIRARFDEYRACSASDPYGGVFGFFSVDFYVRLAALPIALYDSKAQPWAVWMAPIGDYLSLDVASLRQLPDGRVGGIVTSSWQDLYVWWVQQNGVWTIDEYHRIEAEALNPASETQPATAAATPSG